MKACFVLGYAFNSCSKDKTRTFEIRQSEFWKLPCSNCQNKSFSKWGVCSLLHDAWSASSLRSRMSQLSVISRELVQTKVPRILLAMALGLIRKYPQSSRALLRRCYICSIYSLVRTWSWWGGGFTVTESWQSQIMTHSDHCPGCENWWLLLWPLTRDEREGGSRGGVRIIIVIVASIVTFIRAENTDKLQHILTSRPSALISPHQYREQSLTLLPSNELTPSTEAAAQGIIGQIRLLIRGLKC